MEQSDNRMFKVGSEQERSYMNIMLEYLVHLDRQLLISVDEWHGGEIAE